ncbi:MAG: toll/interleukin-1 receptor domain-containing protein [Nostocaceae cyanobacterium]|nr:toll/interleukin-1 receptor domain-containing protein [Nostocaceae cyanobacterium]
MRIFISYKRQDEAFARQLCQNIHKQGFNTWLDVKDILPTDNWREAIHKGIRESDAVIAVITPESLTSKNVLQEWGWAETNNKPIIVIWLRDIDEAQVPLFIINQQRIDFRDSEDQGFSRLHDALVKLTRTVLNDPKQPIGSNSETTIEKLFPDSPTQTILTLSNLPSRFVSRPSIRDKVVALLLDTQNSQVLILANRGGGEGKTATARDVCRDNRITQHFKKIFGITFGERPNSLAILRSALEQVTKQDSANISDDNLESCLLQNLELPENDPILMVLDDIWYGHEEIVDFFLTQLPYSCIKLITSRYRELSKHSLSVEIPPMTDMESTELLLATLTEENRLMLLTERSPELMGLVEIAHGWPHHLGLISFQLNFAIQSEKNLFLAVKKVYQQLNQTQNYTDVVTIVANRWEEISYDIYTGFTCDFFVENGSPTTLKEFRVDVRSLSQSVRIKYFFGWFGRFRDERYDFPLELYGGKAGRRSNLNPEVEDYNVNIQQNESFYACTLEILFIHDSRLNWDKNMLAEPVIEWTLYLKNRLVNQGTFDLVKILSEIYAGRAKDMKESL